MLEIETKVLEINKDKIIERLKEIGAVETKNIRLFIDWYGTKESITGEHPWYLRVRTNTLGEHEITWKSLAKHVGNTRQSKEINIHISDYTQAKNFLIAIGFIQYAHQEKDRISFVYKNWNFDVDTYPSMPTYLEIEGMSEDHVKEAINLLELDKHVSISEGETKLIRERYGLDWNNMYFDK